MDKKDSLEQNVIRPVARTLARELTADELSMVSGGACNEEKDPDCTTSTGLGSDRDMHH